MAVALALGGLAGCAEDSDRYDIATVVKVSGIQWFNRMEEGVRQFASETSHNTFQLGPAQADAVQQMQIVEDMIAQNVDAIIVVPFAPEALESVLRRALDRGIVVISHEASNQQNVHWNLEAFNNTDFGTQIMDNLAECMEGEGEYAVFVGSLTSLTHNQWVDAAIARQREMYPNMSLVGTKNETNDDQQTAYARTQELLRAYPNLKGFQGSASTDVGGIGLAIEERGLEDRTCVVGGSLPSIAGQYLETGAVDKIFFWDPALAGLALNRLALMVLEGEEISEGMSLGVQGYESVRLAGKVIYGQASVTVDRHNMDDYPF
jgi:simple sugar transport system substrate-binding protein